MFKVIVYLDGKKDTYIATQIVPIPDSGLLVITLETGEVVVYPINKIKKYSFIKE